MPSTASPSPPRITELRVRNYRALRDLALTKLTPLTVLLGPNGSGKSTVFDVFAFLSECFTDGVRKAWDRRGRFRELRSRNSRGPIVVELKYRETRESAHHVSPGARRGGRTPGGEPRVSVLDARRQSRPALQVHGLPAQQPRLVPAPAGFVARPSAAAETDRDRGLISGPRAGRLADPVPPSGPARPVGL